MHFSARDKINSYEGASALPVCMMLKVLAVKVVSSWLKKRDKLRQLDSSGDHAVGTRKIRAPPHCWLFNGLRLTSSKVHI